MNEAMLRRWVAGELDADQRLEVTRWMVCCTDPALPAVLRGLIRERADARADAAERARGSAFGRLVDHFAALWERGAAILDVGGPTLVPASDTTPSQATVLSVSESADGVVLATIDAPATSAREVAIYLTSDGVEAVRVWGPAAAPSGPVRVPPPFGERPTLWAIWGTTLPRVSSTTQELLAALGDSSVEHAAVRWIPDV
jgi:hypothetical protein